MGFRRPRPRPPKSPPATDTLSAERREALAQDAKYVGSPHHTNFAKFGLSPAPREGWMTLSEAEDEKAQNPDCLVCPKKWVHRQRQATELLQAAINAGTFVAAHPEEMPKIVWARDPEDDIVYEAKLCQQPKGYKAYPLTSFQVEYNLPFKLL